MVKRSREDFEPSSPESSGPEDIASSVSLRVVQYSLTDSHKTTHKIVQLDPESGEASSKISNTEMRCSLPPHRQTLSFQNFEEYEVHYAKEHTHRCLECRKNFPTGHFLNLHIEENHDSLVSVRRERGEKTYSCFVIDCDRVCSTPQKRRMHLIDKHCFPKEYDFYVVNDGIDRRSSMLKSGRHRRGSSATIQSEKARRRASTLDSANVTEKGEETMKVDVPEDEKQMEDLPAATNPAKAKENDDMEGLIGGMSALKFVPPSVRFGRGRGRGRGGFSRS